MKLSLLKVRGTKRIQTLVDTEMEPDYKEHYLQLDGSPFPKFKEIDTKPEYVLTRGGKREHRDAWKQVTTETATVEEVMEIVEEVVAPEETVAAPEETIVADEVDVVEEIMQPETETTGETAGESIEPKKRGRKKKNSI